MERCSLIIPTYNEAENIKQLISIIFEEFSKWNGMEVEIIIVDDNSQDHTQEIIEGVKDERITLVKRPKKLGIGSAYRDAFKYTHGKLICIMDADFSHDPKKLIQLIKSHDQTESCVVLGTRYAKEGVIIGWNFCRKLISRVANTLAKTILIIKASDVTGSYRIYSRSMFQRIIEKSVAPGFAFQVEAIFLATRYQANLVEVPITYTDRKKGRSKFNISEIVNFAFIIVRLFILLCLNKY